MLFKFHKTGLSSSAACDGFVFVNPQSENDQRIVLHFLLDTSRYTINNAEKSVEMICIEIEIVKREGIIASSNDMFDNTYVVSMLQEDW